MRAVTEREYAHVFGGGTEQDPTVLPTTTVTSTPLPPNGGFGTWVFQDSSPIDTYEAQNDVDHIDNSDPFDDGQDADDNVSEQEFENAMKFIAQMAEAGKFGIDGLGSAFKAVDWTQVMVTSHTTQYQYAMNDYNAYEDSMGADSITKCDVSGTQRELRAVS